MFSVFGVSLALPLPPCLQNFCSQVVRLKPRNDADSRPLCLLLAGIITSLASQLTHSIEAHRAHSERLMDKLRQEMADMQVRP